MRVAPGATLSRRTRDLAASPRLALTCARDAPSAQLHASVAGGARTPAGGPTSTRASLGPRPATAAPSGSSSATGQSKPAQPTPRASSLTSALLSPRVSPVKPKASVVRNAYTPRGMSSLDMSAVSFAALRVPHARQHVRTHTPLHAHRFSTPGTHTRTRACARIRTRTHTHRFGEPGPPSSLCCATRNAPAPSPRPWSIHRSSAYGGKLCASVVSGGSTALLNRLVHASALAASRSNKVGGSCALHRPATAGAKVVVPVRGGGGGGLISGVGAAKPGSASATSTITARPATATTGRKSLDPGRPATAARKSLGATKGTSAGAAAAAKTRALPGARVPVI